MENKEVYREKMEAKLKEWDAELTELKAKLSQAKADAKIEYQKKIEDFKDKKEALEKKMDEFRSAGDDTWKEIKSRVEKAASDLLSALDRAKSSMH